MLHEAASQLICQEKFSRIYFTSACTAEAQTWFSIANEQVNRQQMLQITDQEAKFGSLDNFP